MLPKALDELARDVESEHEASTRLSRALKPCDKRITRAHQLELITRILDHTCKSHSETAENAFRVALGSLRTLVPFLKKKNTSATDTIASVEKYAVNFALSSSSQGVKSSTAFSREDELITSLQQIFSSRAEAQKETTEKKGVTRRRNVRRKHDKENEDPDQSLWNISSLESELVDQLYFPHATRLGLQMLLPNRDSIEVATTTAGALAIRLTNCCRDMCLSDTLVLTEKAVLPWLNYVRSFSDERSQRTAAAYLKRVSRFLFDQCRMPRNDPATVLRTRLFALQLDDPKLNQFARDVLQSVNNFARTKKQEKHSRHVMDIIIPVYEGALRYVSRFDSSDQRWISEDVSAWFDNIALIWAKQKPKKSIPNVFVLRVSAFRTQSHMKHLVDCFKLQIDLFNAGAYQLDAEMVARQNTKKFNLDLWKRIAFLLTNLQFEDLLDSDENALFQGHSAEFRNDWNAAEADGFRCLRLMRTLEPVRRFIAVTSPKYGLPQGAETVLRTYLSALLRGFYVLSWPVISTDTSGASAIQDILLRLNKMVGGGMEAARDLIRFYAHQRLFDSLQDVASLMAEILQHHKRHSSSASLSWAEWLYNVMTSISKTVFLELKKEESEEDVLVLRLSEAMLLSANQLLIETSNSSSLSRGYTAVLTTLRDGLLSLRLWSEATDVSLQLFDYVTSSGIEGRHHIVASEAARMVAQDVARLTRNGNILSFFGDLNISADKLLSVFVEYSWWTRKNRDSFKTSSIFLETIDALTLMRKAVFQFCDMSGLLCTARRTHEQWLAFVHSLNSQQVRKKERIWKSVKPKICSGHYTVGLAGEPHASHVSCTTLHSQFLENVKKACEATVLRSFNRVAEFLCALESAFTVNKKLLRHLELITFAVEALEWISTVLAFNSYGVSAARAASLAHECSSLFDVSLSSCETLKICRLLDGLPERVPPNEAAEEGEALVTVSRNNDVRWTSEASRSLQEATSDLKGSLRKLWKFRMGSDENCSQSYDVGGLSVDVRFNLSSVCGQYRLGLVLELVRCLFRLGTTQFDIENLSEARYYVELCFQISFDCFPVENNSYRRIASISKAKCMTRKDSSTAVQDSIMKHVPVEEEDKEDGRDVCSSFSSLQTAADAMLYVGMAWKLESKPSSETDGAHVDFIAALYERCRRRMDALGQTATSLCDLDTERARLELNLGLTHLLKGDETTAVKLIGPLSVRENLRDRDVMAAASYEVARLCIRRAGGLRACIVESSAHSSSHNNLPPSRRSRRLPRRNNLGKSQTSMDETRVALRRAVQNLVPYLGNFPLYRKVWNLTAMVETEPELMAWGLEKTVGLSFDARYGHTIRRRHMNRTGDVLSENNPDANICDMTKHLRQLSLDDTTKLDHHSHMTEIMAMMTHRKSVLAGVHMDEDKTSIVVWRRCAFGFHVSRLWLPSSGTRSYDGIVQRIESVLHEVKASSIREGQEMTKDEKVSWWEDRYKLDDEIKSALTDIQDVWLGTAINLLIPSLFVDSAKSAQIQKRDFEDYIELGERACDPLDDCVALGQLILLVDKRSERIPWESLPCLREREISATRTPSMSFLANTWNPNRYFDHSSVFYVLNPDGNLRRTEDRFRDKLRSHTTWSGITGQTSADVIASSYKGEEIYLYCGHGAGEGLFSPSKLCAHQRAPIALLMGCSSCRPREMEIGDFESNGPAIEFLAHGSPAVVGNLWDVSDGEIDRLTSSVLSLWLGDDDKDVQSGSVSLADAVARSRSKCRLPYLVGAACIVMGVPHIYVRRHTES